MKIQQFISLNRIVFFELNKKQQILEKLVKVISTSEQIPNESEFLKAIKERENLLSTGIGFGIAIPHAKLEGIKDFVIAIGISRDGIEYESLDEKPVHIIVMIAGPSGRQKDYLSLLSRVLLILKNSQVRKQLLKCQTKEEVNKIFLQY